MGRQRHNKRNRVFLSLIVPFVVAVVLGYRQVSARGILSGGLFNAVRRVNDSSIEPPDERQNIPAVPKPDTAILAQMLNPKGAQPSALSTTGPTGGSPSPHPTPTSFEAPGFVKCSHRR